MERISTNRIRWRRACANRWAAAAAAIVLLLGSRHLEDTALVVVSLAILGVALGAHLYGYAAHTEEIDAAFPSETLPELRTVAEYIDRSARIHSMLPGVIIVRPRVAGGSVNVNKSVLLNDAAEAVRSALRPEDVIARTEDGALAIALSARMHMPVETLIQIALRIQRRLCAPVATTGGHVRFDAAIGICGPNVPWAETGEAIVAAGVAALARAEAAGPDAIRMATAEDDPQDCLELRLATDLDLALSTGQIVAFFQPQVSTDTGELSGMEALARWIHPECGMISPAAFLPTIDAAGAQQALTDTILSHALEMLSKWDERGLDVPGVSINVTYEDLTDRTLVGRIEWMLDRHGIAPERLGIEVLETVLSIDGNDIVPETLGALHDLGCRIDLDDFGTGQASISSIRKFCIDRLKIDRSFVRNLDEDSEQQGMVAAIVTMAEHLGLDVVAEGVETAGEHARAAQLGCTHVQGFGIARPIRADAVAGWLWRWRQERSAISVPNALRDITGGATRPRIGGAPSQTGRGKTA